MRQKPNKPLGRKAYGSIPHLPNSRLGPGDHSCHEGQMRICLETARDRHDRIIVTEKLDGSNVAIARINGEIVALTRSGHTAVSSPRKQHHLFDSWVKRRETLFRDLLEDGVVLHGEWLAQAHGTLYALPHDPFVVFDVTRGGHRLPWDETVGLCRKGDLVIPRVLSDGGPFSLGQALPLLEWSGHGVAEGEMVEGAVWRVERRGTFDFIAKWVRPEKIDGKYLAENSGGDTIWLWSESTP